MRLEKTKKYLSIDIVLCITLVFFAPTCWGADSIDKGESSFSRSVRVNLDNKGKEEKMTPISKDDVKKHPHSAILSVICEFIVAGESLYQTGTGFFIDNNFALTAAHVLYLEGRFADKVYCYIKQHGKYKKKNKVRVEKYVYPNEYKFYLLDENRYQFFVQQEAEYENMIEAQEIAQNAKSIKDETMEDMKEQKRKLIESRLRLEQDLKNKHRYGVMSDYVLLHFNRQTDSTIKLPEKLESFHLRDVQFWFCGYPGQEYNIREGERDHSHKFYPYETLATLKSWGDFSANLVKFSTLAYRGMSGSPVRFKDQNGEWKAIGTLIAEIQIDKKKKTYCCRLTSKIIERIHQWQEYINAKKEVEVRQLTGILKDISQY